ncbi:MAG: TIGR03986 family type III CRISPR-associated RAMP protein [Clostridium sp.]|uniref:TIGR03986 family type III CRISPR-associated RAMP protein n=1 Tax=Clostridium sp. TaxID=1506 RepID=UPI003F344B5B
MGSITSPYNFIPFSDKVIKRYENIKDIPKENDINEELLSGSITYEIENDNELIISSGLKEGEKTSRFNTNIEGKQTIPGSSIRGVIRSNVLTLGLCSFDDEIEDGRYLYRRTMNSKNSEAEKILDKEYGKIVDKKTPAKFNNSMIIDYGNVKGGYIVKEGKEYYVYPAKEKRVGSESKTYFRVHNNIAKKYGEDLKDRNYKPYQKRVNFKVDNNKNVTIGNGNGYLPGVLMNSNKFGSKKNVKVYHYILNEKDESKKYKIPKKNMEFYINHFVSENVGFNLEEDIKGKKKDPNKEEREEGLRTCFFTHNGKEVTNLSFTHTIKVFYSKSIKDGLNKNHMECFDYQKALFGFINYGEKNEKLKSRISFLDAVVDGRNGNVQIKEMLLASPKASCYKAYLGENQTYSSSKISLRGRKFYWLKNAKAEFLNKDANVNSYEEVLEKGKTFKGEIRFNNLYKDELGLLIYALKLDGRGYQQIGKGKPYGYGRIKIKNIELSLDMEKEYSLENLFFENEKEYENVSEYIKEYKKYVKKEFSINLDKEKSVQILLGVMSKKVIRDLNKVKYLQVGNYAKSESLDDVEELLKTLE